MTGLHVSCAEWRIPDEKAINLRTSTKGFIDLARSVWWRNPHLPICCSEPAIGTVPSALDCQFPKRGIPGPHLSFAWRRAAVAQHAANSVWAGLKPPFRQSMKHMVQSIGRTLSDLCSLRIVGICLGATFAVSVARAQDAQAVQDEIRRVQQIQRAEIRDLQDQQASNVRQEYLEKMSVRESEDGLLSPVILAPMPPVLFAETVALRDLVYDEALLPAVGEPFFMAYAGLHTAGRLKPKNGQRIAKYFDSRDRVLALLRERLRTLSRLPETEQSAAIASFARSDEQDLQALSVEAEAIRSELAGFNDGALLEKRRQTLGPDGSKAFIDFCSALLAAEFHAGLSSDQRELLHAIALEALVGDEGLSPASGPLFFLPATSRLVIPGDLDESAMAKLEEFQRLLANLKQGLRAGVLESSPRLSAAKRTKQYAALGGSQSVSFLALHRLADDLRPALWGALHPQSGASTGFPSALLQEVGQVLEKNVALRREASRRCQSFGRELAPARTKLVTRKGVPSIEVLPPLAAGVSGALPKSEHQAALARLEAYNGQLTVEYRTLVREMERVRALVKQYQQSLGPSQYSDTERLTAQMARAYTQQESAQRFAEYRAAVLMPGLSPAQRRLLFNAALRDLEKHRLQAVD